MKKDITIVLPVYNAENHLKETLDSIYNQTFDGSIELLIINDGSVDNSMKVISEYLNNNHRENIEVHTFDDGENKGPGTRRNFGLKNAKGKALQFLDSDDILMPEALKMGFEKLLEKESNSFVSYEWAFYYDETDTTVYSSIEPYDKFRTLAGRSCEMLLRSSSYFTVHKLYRTSFLLDNEIFYGEGYIYEDFEFFVKAAINAIRVPLLSNVLYKVRVHDSSITKSDSHSMKHYDSFLIAIAKTYYTMLNGVRSKETPYHVTKYFLGRALIYSDRRIPKGNRLKYKFLKEVLKVINEYYPNLAVPKGLSPYYYQMFNSGAIKQNNVRKLLKIEKQRQKGRINYYNHRQKMKIKKHSDRKVLVSKAKSMIEKNYYLKPLVYNSRRFVHKNRKKRRVHKQNRLKNIGIKETIVMLGFDYKYTGNSRYLFEYLKTKYSEEQLKFVTTDVRVPQEYRIKPRSDEFYKTFYSSKVVIAESWIPGAFEKIEGQTWIQLWHGTPLKRLLFDAHESDLLRLNPRHRVKMKADIERWDYLLSDSKMGAEKFHSAYDVPMEKIVNFGYPRNEYLVKNRDNEELKRKIKLKYRLPLDKKILLYVPTWRDYNYKKSQNNYDISYLADLNNILTQLGKNYIAINKGHSMEKNLGKNIATNIFQSHSAMETQELLLISDIILTDYSSIVYDGVHIDTPFYMIVKDKKKFEKSRGAYSDMMHDIEKVTFSNENELSEAIKYNHYERLTMPQKYYNSNIKDASESIYRLIDDLI